LIWPTSAAEMELQALRVQKVRPVLKAPLVRKEFRDSRVCLVLMERKELKVRKACRATLALRACRAFKDLQETMERKDFQDQMGHRGHKAHKVRKDQPAGLSLSKAER
jgi:hypothetical protein